MKADDILDHRGIDYMLIEQDRPTLKCKDSAEERGVSERQIVKSLIVRQEGDCIHCLLPGNRDLDEEKLDGSIEMVSGEEVEDLTGCEPGTVHPFASDLPVLVDERLLEQDELSFTSGDPYHGIILSQDAFLDAIADREFDVKDISSRELSPAERYANEHNITAGEASDILDHGDRELFEKLARQVGAGTASTFVRFKERAAEGKDDPDDLTADQLATVIEESSSEEQTRSAITTLLDGEDPELGDEIDLDAVIDTVIEENQQAVQDYRDGEDEAINHLIGQVMKQSHGRADPGEARGRLTERL